MFVCENQADGKIRATSGLESEKGHIKSEGLERNADRRLRPWALCRKPSACAGASSIKAAASLRSYDRWRPDAGWRQFRRKIESDGHLERENGVAPMRKPGPNLSATAHLSQLSGDLIP